MKISKVGSKKHLSSIEGVFENDINIMAEVGDDSVKSEFQQNSVFNIDVVVGAAGKSAYEVWLEAGNTGTMEDFLNEIASSMTYKGTVNTKNDLPIEGNKIGDFYNIKDTGHNYAWDGDEWDPVGDMVDIKPLTEKIEEIEETLVYKIGYVRNLELNDNLNNIKDAGLYRNLSNANATPENNYPFKQAGVLNVERTVGGGVAQTYKTYDQNRIFIRNIRDNIISDWKELASIEEVQDSVKDSIMAKDIFREGNINTLQNGSYRLYNADKTKLSGLPDFDGALIDASLAVLGISDKTDLRMFLMTIRSNRKMYYKMVQAQAQVTAWKEVTTVDELSDYIRKDSGVVYRKPELGDLETIDQVPTLPGIYFYGLNKINMPLVGNYGIIIVEVGTNGVLAQRAISQYNNVMIYRTGHENKNSQNYINNKKWIIPATTKDLNEYTKKINILKGADYNLDTVTEPGTYRIESTAVSIPALPVDIATYSTMLVMAGQDTLSQMIINRISGRTITRGGAVESGTSNIKWSSWKELVSKDDLKSVSGESIVGSGEAPLKEAYLQWGGKSLASTFSPVDAGLNPRLGANRLAFMPANAVDYEYSNDGGVTWHHYNLTDENKIKFFNGDTVENIRLGNNTAKNVDLSKFKTRITINSPASNVYTGLNKFIIYSSSEGAQNVTVTIDKLSKSSFDAGTEDWKDVIVKHRISGWPGYNVINTHTITTYSNSGEQSVKVRFTFEQEGTNDTYLGTRILSISGYGGVGWKAPSNLALYGTMYRYDYQQNTIFPKDILVNGSKRALSTDDLADIDGKLNNKVSKEDGKGLSTNDFTNTLKTKLDGLDTQTELDDKFNAKANDNEVVKTTGSQTDIKGRKRFDLFELMNNQRLNFIEADGSYAGRIYFNNKIATITNSGKNGEIAVMSDLDTKANDNEVVKTTGNQTIAGSKRFQDVVVVDSGISLSSPTSPHLISNRINTNLNSLTLTEGGIGFSRFDIGTLGAPSNGITNSANLVMTLNRHSGNYNSQLVFGNKGSIHYRLQEGGVGYGDYRQIAFTNDTVAAANILAGFSSRRTGSFTAVMPGRYVTGMNTSDSGSFEFKVDSGQLNMAIDGSIWVEEGLKKLATEQYVDQKITGSMRIKSFNTSTGVMVLEDF